MTRLGHVTFGGRNAQALEPAWNVSCPERVGSRPNRIDGLPPGIDCGRGRAL